MLMGLGCLYVMVTSAPISLEDAISSAFKKSENIGSAEALVARSEAQYRQGIGAILPRVEGFGSLSWQERTSSDTLYSNDRPAKTLGIRGTQILFRGLQEWFGLRQLQSLAAVSRYEAIEEKLRLTEAVASSYYEVLSLLSDRASLQSEIDVYEKRLKTLGARQKIGRTRLSEVLNTETALERFRAQLATLTAQLKAERQRLEFLSGVSQSDQLSDSVILPENLEGVEKYLVNIKRPKIQAAEARAQAANEAVRSAWGAHLPTIEAHGNYYVKRPRPLEDRNWDVSLEINLPLFAGGATQARISEAQAESRRGQLELSKAKREVELEVRQHFADLQGRIAEMNAYAKARSVAKRNSEEQISQYELGLVTNLDVLDAIDALAVTERSYERSRYGAKLALIRLQIASGQKDFSK